MINGNVDGALLALTIGKQEAEELTEQGEFKEARARLEKAVDDAIMFLTPVRELKEPK